MSRELLRIINRSTCKPILLALNETLLDCLNSMPTWHIPRLLSKNPAISFYFPPSISFPPKTFPQAHSPSTNPFSPTCTPAPWPPPALAWYPLSTACVPTVTAAEERVHQLPPERFYPTRFFLPNPFSPPIVSVSDDHLHCRPSASAGTHSPTRGSSPTHRHRAPLLSTARLPAVQNPS